jgi:hypothetical protein
MPVKSSRSTAKGAFEKQYGLRRYFHAYTKKYTQRLDQYEEHQVAVAGCL